MLSLDASAKSAMSELSAAQVWVHTALGRTLSKIKQTFPWKNGIIGKTQVFFIIAIPQRLEYVDFRHVQDVESQNIVFFTNKY